MSVRVWRLLLPLCCGFSLLLAVLWGGRQQPVALLAVEPTRVQPTALPSPVPQKTPGPSALRPPVATLLLTVPETPAQLYSVVQWQDDNGGWNNVEGWRGAVSGGRTTWWVEQKDWGAGPYRWVIYAPGEEADQILAVSEEFYLPTRQGELKHLSVLLP